MSLPFCGDRITMYIPPDALNRTEQEAVRVSCRVNYLDTSHVVGRVAQEGCCCWCLCCSFSSFRPQCLLLRRSFLQSPQPPHPFFSPTRRLPLKAFTPTPRRGNCRDYGLTFSSDAGRTCQGNGRFLVSSLSLMWAALAPIRRRNLAYVASKLGPSLYLTGERLQAIGDCSPKQAQRQSLCRFARQLFKESEGWSEHRC